MYRFRPLILLILASATLAGGCARRCCGERMGLVDRFRFGMAERQCCDDTPVISAGIPMPDPVPFAAPGGCASCQNGGEGPFLGVPVDPLGAPGGNGIYSGPPLNVPQPLPLVPQPLAPPVIEEGEATPEPATGTSHRIPGKIAKGIHEGTD